MKEAASRLAKLGEISKVQANGHIKRAYNTKGYRSYISEAALQQKSATRAVTASGRFSDPGLPYQWHYINSGTNEFDNKNMLLNREKFDIHEVIKNTAASFEGTCTQKKISIELLLATKHLQVYADKRKIHQVLYNLLDNAIKFSDPESTVTIETTERGEKVYISVKDYGIGIPRNALNKIWERFYKTDLSRGKDKKGTGLGLAIVKEAIQAHGENINVISTEGVGTEFIFSLPKKAQDS